jgi:class II flagellar assembly regulator FliX
LPGDGERRKGVGFLRIESNTRTNSVGRYSSLGRSGTGSGFAIAEEASATRIANTEPLVGATGIDALLALQAADDPLLGRRKAVRRGTSLLDILETMKADLLAGQVSEGRLNQLMTIVTSARERAYPGLDELLDDIELRARVELAKFGRYPR